MPVELGVGLYSEVFIFFLINSPVFNNDTPDAKEHAYRQADGEVVFVPRHLKKV